MKMAKFTDLKDEAFKNNVIKLVENFHKDYLPDSYQVSINGDVYSIGGNSYSNTIISAACQTYIKCQKDFANGEWAKIQETFKSFLYPESQFYGLEYNEADLKPYLNMRVIYYNALYNTISYNVMTNETTRIPDFVSKEEIKNSVCWLLTYGEYIQADLDLEDNKTKRITKIFEIIKGIYDNWKTWKDKEHNYTSEQCSILAQTQWLLGLEDLRSSDLGIAIPPSDNGSGEIFGYSHIASVIWWLKTVLQDVYGIKDFSNYPFYDLSKISVSSKQNINVIENWKTISNNSNQSKQKSSNSQDGMFEFSDDNIKSALSIVFSPYGVPLILDTKYVQGIASESKKEFSYQLLAKQQCKFYSNFWKNNIKNFISSSSEYKNANSNTFPSLYQEDEQGEIIFDKNYNPKYTFIDLKSLNATKENLNNTSWELSSNSTPENSSEKNNVTILSPSFITINKNKTNVSGPTLLITNINKSTDKTKINGITFKLKGLSSDYDRGDRIVWLSIEDGEGKLIADQRNYELPLEKDENVYHIPDGEAISRDIDGKLLKWNFADPIPYNDTKYKIYCKIAWSPATLCQEYMLDNEMKKEWEWLIDSKAYTSIPMGAISPIFTLKEIQNNNFKVGQPVSQYKNYFYDSFGQKILDVYQNLSNKTQNNFCDAMKDFCRSKNNKEIRELLKYMALPSFENIYQKIINSKSNISPLNSYLQGYYSQKMREDPREKQIYTIIGSFQNIQAPSLNNTITTLPTINYKDWLTPEVTVSSVGSSQYKALFPPILESSQPAFNALTTYEYEIFFKLSNYTNFNEVGHVDFRIVFQGDNSSAINSSYWIDEIIYVPHKHININSNGTYSIKIPVNFIKNSAWEASSYYKIQARLGTDFGMWEVSNPSSGDSIQTTNTDVQKYREWRDNQIRNGQFSEWSTVMVIKPIVPPTVQILNSLKANGDYSFENITFKPVEFTDQPQIYGFYKSTLDENNKQQELLDYYNFDLYEIDVEGLEHFIESSDWNKYDGSLNILNKNGLSNDYLIDELTNYNMLSNSKDELISSAVVLWQPKNKLEQNKQYHVYFTVQTQNKYIDSASYEFQISYTSLDYFGRMDKEELLAIPNEEEGMIELRFYSGTYNLNGVNYDATISGNFVVTRCKVGENIWEDVQHFSVPELQKSYNYETLCYDLTVESGIEYKYAIQREYHNSIRSNRLESNSVIVNFEYNYLVGENKQLKIKFDPKISSFKHTILASKQDTLGGKYPLILRNGQTYYAEFPIEGLITLHSDENAMFITRKNNGIYYNDEQIIPSSKFKQQIQNNSNIIRNNRGDRAELLGQNNVKDTYYFDTNLTDNNIFIERKFREKVEEFLNNSSPKLFKSATEGNIIVNLMNVSLTPKQELGRAIYSFSATAYEITENTIDNLKKYNIINFHDFNPVLQEGYTMGQISGYFDQTTDIVRLIKQDVVNRSGTEIQFEPQAIKQIKFEHYPKVSLENEIEKINYNISMIKTHNEQYAENASQKIEELREQRNTLIELQKYLDLKNGYPPCELKINQNKITMLGDKPFQLDNLNWQFGSNSIQIIPYEYKQDNVSQPIPVPMIITYVVSIQYIETTKVHAEQGNYYKSLDSIYGYFVNPESKLSNIFAYNFYEYLDNYNESEETMPQKETSKILYNDIYYNNYDVMQVIVNKIEQDFERKATNKDLLIRLKEFNGTAVQKPTWYFLDSGQYYLLEFINIQELIIEADPGTTFYLNKDSKEEGSKISIGANGLYQLSPLERDMINTNKTLLIDKDASPNMTYLNLRFVYELNIIQTTSKYLQL